MSAQADDAPPNFVFILTDDQGYNDLGCYGSPDIRTPQLDRMAREGVRMTSHYVGSPVCGPSRAAIMTGSYPMRVAEPDNRKRLHTELHTDEQTMPEVLREKGYATALIGKWHLGGSPNDHGFDLFLGTRAYNGYTKFIDQADFRAKIHRNEEVVIDRVEQPEMDRLTTMYTEESLRFIEENRDQPFFLFLSHNMPHVPLGVSDKFRGKSERGLYGDVIMEIDWSVGEVLAKLAELGLDANTMVVFMSDNGPWIEERIGDHGGSAAPLRGSKMKSWEGGPRVPCIAHWPGRIPAGRTSDAVTTAMDWMPTFAALADARLAEDRVIDGRNIMPLLAGENDDSPHDAVFFYCHTHLHAVRQDRWKLVLPRPAHPEWMGWWGPRIDGVDEEQLFDLDRDISETTNVADQHPDVVRRLKRLLETAREDLGERHLLGSGQRFFDETPRRPDIEDYEAWHERRID